LNCLALSTAAFAGKSNVANTNLKNTMQEDFVGVLIFKPDDDKEFRLSIIGSIRHFIGGLDPMQNPASTMFSEIIRTAGDKFRITKRTGQRLTEVDLNKGISSVEPNSEMVFLLLDCPLACTMHEPSHYMSFKMPSLLLEQNCKNSQQLLKIADKGLTKEMCTKWPEPCAIDSY